MSPILIIGSTDGLGRLTQKPCTIKGTTSSCTRENLDRAGHLRPLTEQGVSLVAAAQMSPQSAIHPNHQPSGRPHTRRGKSQRA